MGFAAPMKEWLRGGFGETARDRVLGSSLMRAGYFHPAHIEDMFRDHRAGRADFSLRLWTLFNLCAWHDRWIAP